MTVLRSPRTRRAAALAASAVLLPLAACSGDKPEARPILTPPVTSSAPAPSETPTPTPSTATPTASTPTPTVSHTTPPLNRWNWARVKVPIDCSGQSGKTERVRYLDVTGDGVLEALVLAACPASMHTNGVAVYDGASKVPIGAVGGVKAAWGVITSVDKGDQAGTFQVVVPDLEGQEYPATVRVFAVRDAKITQLDEYVTAPD